MNESSPAAVVARASRLVGAEIEERRRAFKYGSSEVTSRFAKAHAYGGSAHREYAEDYFKKELHARADLFVSAFETSHKAMSASPSDDHLRAGKSWFAAQIAAASEELGKIHDSQIHVEGLDARAVFQTAAKHETETAYARLDNIFAQLQRASMERLRRRAVRVLGSIKLMLPFGK